MPPSAPVSTSVPLKSVETGWPALLVLSSVMLAKSFALPSTGASLMALTVMAAVSSVDEKAVMPPRVVASARLPAEPVL
jgi:hypothetical protein